MQGLMKIPNVLSIAGLDPSGGAGVLADVKTMSALGCYGMAALTAVTVQNTRGVSLVQPLDAGLVAAQLNALFDDIRIDAVKIGMLGEASIVRAVADVLADRRPKFVVLDPVAASTSGTPLASEEARRALLETLFPLATLATPNLDEARLLTDSPTDLNSDEEIEAAGRKLLGLGARAVLIKGGHGTGPLARDLLVWSGGSRQFEQPRLPVRNTHGSGCALASAIACGLAQGMSLEAAVGEAKAWLTNALRGADRLDVGRGRGPFDHFWESRASAESRS